MCACQNFVLFLMNEKYYSFYLYCYLHKNRKNVNLQVRLDQVKEDAGRNCITYMANALIMWRDTQPESEARQLLYR